MESVQEQLEEDCRTTTEAAAPGATERREERPSAAISALVPARVPDLDSPADPAETWLRGGGPLDERDGLRGQVVLEQRRVLLT